MLDPDLPSELEALVEPLARGDPDSPLRWTNALAAAGRAAPSGEPREGRTVIAADGLQPSGKSQTEEGSDHPGRDAQFRYINEKVREALTRKRPVISVDTKKKEILVNYQNEGRQWLKTKSPQKVNVHDFPGPSVPRAYPYGIYDLGQNTGFVNVGVDHDTGAFAVASIRGWWRAEGDGCIQKPTLF